jgi:hypothetical protein
MTKPDIIRLRNKWVEVDPRDWKNRNDLTISVGLGAGNKDSQMMHLNNILQMQKEALAAGITSPEKIYNALAKLTQNAGFKNPEEFWTNPSENPEGQQPPPPDPNQALLEGQLQIESLKAQSEQQIAQQKAEAQFMQEQERSKNDIIIEREKMAAQMELERYKAQLRAETDLAIAQIKAGYGQPTL